MSETLRSVLGIGPRPAAPDSGLIERCENALDLPLDRQTPESLRLLIGQGIGLDILIPAALELLSNDLLVSGDMHPGDLLASCQRAPAGYWLNFPGQWARLNDMLNGFDEVVIQINKNRSVFFDNNPFGAVL